MSVSGAAYLATRRTGRLLDEAAIWPVEIVTGTYARATSPTALIAAVAAATNNLSEQTATVEPAVAPAAEASVSTALAASDAATLLISSAVTMTAKAKTAPSAMDLALVAASVADMLAAMADLAVYIDHASRTDAASWRTQAVAALDALIDALSPLLDTIYAGAASTVIRSAVDLRARLITYINETIGNLPAVVTVSISQAASAWEVANHLYGNDPSAVEAGYQAIVRRNRPRHPARLEAGRIEALK